MNILLTGATSGLGLNLVKNLIKKKQIKKIICLGRDFSKIQYLKGQFKKKIIFAKCDLSEKRNIDKIIKKLKFISTIDILINNAGMITINRQLNSLNINKIFFINFIAPIYLILKLKNKIYKSKKKLIINIVSHANNVNLQNLKKKDLYNNDNSWEQYKRSKFFLILFTYFFNSFNKIQCICINPGRIRTCFGKDSFFLIRKIYYLYNYIFGKNPSKISIKITRIIFKKDHKTIYYNFHDKKKFYYDKKKKEVIKNVLNNLSTIFKEIPKY